MNQATAEHAQSEAVKPKPKRKPNPKAPRQGVLLLAPEARLEGCREVALGLSAEQVKIELSRCLQCVDPKCIEACPLHIDIKAVIAALENGDVEAAFAKISEQSPFPGICGRVCQHELFCEKDCLMGKKLKPVAIGALERFVADQHRQLAETASGDPLPAAQGPRIALVGSGPASLIAAFDLVRKGYRVTVFEALHELGGVLSYGIPNFRLPREILHEEIDRLRKLGVEFRTDFIVGRTSTVEELFAAGYAAIFLGTGAGLPHLMGIPGENLIGVYTANELLTRINLMQAYKFPEADTPVRVGKRTVVVGGGNSAMDAARWARRMGSETTILFRRGRAELRARIEEIDHAEEEGVHFEFLAAPVRLLSDEKGNLAAMECIRMKLGEPDESGRPSPVPIPGSEYRVPVDTVVMAIGQSPNPTVQKATPQLVTSRGKIVVDESGQTSMARVFAGGDVARGGSTVILAMRDGRAAAEAIDRVVRQESQSENRNSKIEIRGSGNRLLAKRLITPEIAWFEVEAPEVAQHWKPGQFVVIRPTAQSERIPLTIVDGNVERGSINLVVQAVGKTSRTTVSLDVGDSLHDLLGPLGQPATIEKVGRVLAVAGGVGVAELLPVARAFREAGNHVTALCGARSSAQILLDEELRAVADEVMWSTDDGSAGFHGTVVDLMRFWKARQTEALGAAHVIGPIPMMRAAAEVTREWKTPTYASLNPIMVDGTGMCGGCRVTVGGKVRFACVDGPEFDAHGVDFDELTRRTRAYLEQERISREQHECRIGLQTADGVPRAIAAEHQAQDKALDYKEAPAMREDGAESISIKVNGEALVGVLRVPDDAEGTVLFACANRQRSPQARYLATVLPQSGLATVLVDLLTLEEDALYEDRLNLDLLAQRLALAARWIKAQPGIGNLPLGLFGAGTSGASVLELAASLPTEIGAIVAWDGRPDLAEKYLASVKAPTLLIVGGKDELVRELNRHAYDKLQAEKELVIIPGATHQFEEPGALQAVAERAADWFANRLAVTKISACREQ